MLPEFKGVGDKSEVKGQEQFPFELQNKSLKIVTFKLRAFNESYHSPTSIKHSTKVDKGLWDRFPFAARSHHAFIHHVSEQFGVILHIDKVV